MEEIDAVVKPLVDSAVSAGEKAGSAIVDLGETALGAVAFVFTAGVGHTATEEQDTVHTTPTPEDAHKTGARESTREKHEEGQARKDRDRGGEKGDARRRPPRKPPNGWKGGWPGLSRFVRRPGMFNAHRLKATLTSSLSPCLGV